MIKGMIEDLPKTSLNAKNKLLFQGGIYRSRTVTVRHLTGTINKMSKHDKDLQDRRIQTLRRRGKDFIYREKNREQNYQLQPV